MKEELQGLAVTRVVVGGDPASKIVELARAEAVDLIVMPTSGHGPIRQFLWGSPLANVLHNSHCPVWTGVHLGQVPPWRLLSFRKLACVIDLGPHTRSALCWAAEFASAVEALLLVFHMVRPATSERAQGSKRDSQLELVKRAREEIENLLKDLDIRAEIAVGSGSAPDVVYEFTLGFAADRLVVGRCAAPGRFHSDTFTIFGNVTVPWSVSNRCNLAGRGKTGVFKEVPRLNFGRKV